MENAFDDYSTAPNDTMNDLEVMNKFTIGLDCDCLKLRFSKLSIIRQQTLHSLPNLNRMPPSAQLKSSCLKMKSMRVIYGIKDSSSEI